MAEFNPTDRTPLKFLGLGVNCTKPEENWKEDLRSNSGRRPRDINNKTEKNFNAVSCKQVLSFDEIHRRESDCTLDISAALSIGVVTREMKSMETTCNTTYTVTKTVTLLDDVSKDPDTITMVSSNQKECIFTKYEEWLCDHILEYVGKCQARQSEEEYHGKLVRNLQGENAIAKVREFMRDDRRQELGQLLADACSDFINNRIKYTHYVYSIDLGTTRKEITKIRRRTSEINMKEEPPPALAKTKSYDELRHVQEIGDENVEEVIQVRVKPVSSLIHRESVNLRNTMEKVLKSYNKISPAEVSGTYTISSRVRGEREVYWQVTGQTVSGTTCRMEASEFFVEYSQADSPYFHIIYKDQDGTKFFVKVKDSKDGGDGLEVVRSGGVVVKSFVLENTDNEQQPTLPARPADWAREYFFIKGHRKPSGQFFALLFRIVQRPYFAEKMYVAMDQKKTTSRHKIDDDEVMLFRMKYKCSCKIEDEPMLHFKKKTVESVTVTEVETNKKVESNKSFVSRARLIACIVLVIAFLFYYFM